MFIEFTEDQKRQANNASIVDVLTRSGYTVKKVGSQFEWKGEGMTVSILDNLWFDHYDQTGGNTLGFVKKYFGMSYPEAMCFILGESEVSRVQLGNQLQARKHSYKLEQNSNNITLSYISSKEPFSLPPQNNNMRRVRAYLETTRGISSEIVNAFASNHMIYESSDYHNVVFVGYDKYGVARHAQKRSSGKNCGWRANQAGSDGRFSFNWRGKSNRLFLFEAPIDMLSYIDMHPDHWYEDTYVSACSVSDQALLQMLKDRPDIQQIYICFDNDGPGQKAAATLWQNMIKSGYDTQILVPTNKDWNEDLLALRQKEGEMECQTEFPFLSL